MAGHACALGGSVLRDWHQLSGLKVSDKSLRLVAWAPGKDCLASRVQVCRGSKSAGEAPSAPAVLPFSTCPRDFLKETKPIVELLFGDMEGEGGIFIQAFLS